MALACGSFLASLCLAEEKSPQEALGLTCAKFDGRTLYYEESLASKLEVFRDRYNKFLAEQAEGSKRTRELYNRSKEIAAEVNRMVGGPVDEGREKTQDFVLGTSLRPALLFADIWDRLDLYLVTRGTVKDYLRKGGALPGFTYDKEADQASYSFGRQFSSRQKIDRYPESLFLPIGDSEPFEKEIEKVFEALRNLCTVAPGIAFHELTEVTMVQWMRFYDPYYRWFTDGFANAVAFRLLQKYVGEEEAEEFLAAYDPSAYSEIEKEINLYYWMGLAFCVKTPLESEDRLDSARYAYATFEAQRLIERAGIECLAAILEKAHKGHINDSRNLVPAIKEVTGEDIEKRFRRYQTFETREKGLAKYAAGFGAAMQRKEYGEALSNLLRVEELNGAQSVKNLSITARLLLLMGHEEAGDEAIKNRLEFLKGRGLEESHFALQKHFVGYALECKNLKKAHETAEEVLKKEPDFVPALAVRMDHLTASGKLSDAKEVARRILELEKDINSAPYKLARAALALDKKQ